MKKICGIYAIVAEKENMVYCGSSIDIKKRYSCHLANLRGNKHFCKELQEIFNKNNDSIKLSILEVCDFEDLSILENKYIEHFNQAGWNVINTKSAAPKSRLDEETRRRMSVLQRGERNGNARLNESDVREIKQAIDDGVFYDRIANEFGISKSHISMIGSGLKWSHVI